MTRLSINETPQTAGEDRPLAKPTPAAATVLTDSLGRRLTIKEPSVLQESRLVRALGDAAMNQAWMMSFAMPAAMVVAVDGEEVPFPMTERQVEAAVERLGRPGLLAVMHHIQAAAETESGEGAVKKSAGTPAFGAPAG